MSLHNSYVMNSSTLGSLGASNFIAACYASHTNLSGTNANAAVFHTNDELLNGPATDVIETEYKGAFVRNISVALSVST